MNKSHSLIFRTAWVHYLLLVALWVLFSIITVYIATSNQQSSPVSFNAYNHYRCKTTNSDALETFQIFNRVFEGSVEIANTFCANLQIASKYKAVEIHWERRKDSLPSAFLGSDIVELVLLSREYMMDAITAPKTNSYTAIAEILAPIKSYFLSKNTSIQLNQDFLNGKKIGLLNEVNSQSRYKLPLEALYNSGVPQENYQIVLYESDYELKKALIAGQVDVIATYLLSYQATPDYSYYIGNIGTQTSFAHSSLIGTGIPCTLIGILKTLSKQKSISYIQRVEAINVNCKT